MKRQHALAGLALGPALAVRSTRAQAKVPRVVMILTGDAQNTAAFSAAFTESMQQAGQVEGRSWRLQVLLGEGEPARSAQHLKPAVAARADVLVVGGLILARQALEATTTIPVVVATGGNLLEGGLVQSLARPGGNLTGISDLANEATVKRLELTRVALPKAARVAVLSNPEFPATARIEARVESAARQLGFAIVRAHATDRASMLRAIDGLRAAAPDALLVIGDALHKRVHPARRGADRQDPARHAGGRTAGRAADEVRAGGQLEDRQGAGHHDPAVAAAARRRGDRAVKSSHWRLFPKYAKALGFTLPPGVLILADEVIE